jgi:hypothetical protein
MDVQARRMRRPLPFALMVTSLAVMLMVVVPVASVLAALMFVVPFTSMVAAVVTRVMPFAFTAVAFFPFLTLPITTPVIVPVTIPARTNDNSGRRLDIHLLGRSVDRLRCIHSTGDSNVYSNIDVCEGDGRYAYAETGNRCHCEPAAA